MPPFQNVGLRSYYLCFPDERVLATQMVIPRGGVGSNQIVMCSRRPIAEHRLLSLEHTRSCWMCSFYFISNSNFFCDIFASNRCLEMLGRLGLNSWVLKGLVWQVPCTSDLTRCSVRSQVVKRPGAHFCLYGIETQSLCGWDSYWSKITLKVSTCNSRIRNSTIWCKFLWINTQVKQEGCNGIIIASSSQTENISMTIQV